MVWTKVKLLLPSHTSRNMVGAANRLITCGFCLYLHTGMLMHFDSLELKDFYFVNPQWLCNVFIHAVLSTNHSKLYQYTWL